MYWTTPQGKLFVICFVINLGLGNGVKVTVELNVPALVDPRDSAVLGCRYDMGGEELYSVKWYKDEQEFFRYTPRQQPHVMEFPVAGVHLAHGDPAAAAPSCDAARCSVELVRLTTTHSSGVYKCEVSTEAPQFRVGFRAANVTVAAVGRAAPRLSGLRAEYAAGDVLAALCVAAPADPAPSLVFLLNGAEAAAAPQRVLPADAPGLLVAQRELRLPAERQLFPAPGAQLRLACEARTPGLPAKPLVSQPHTARLLTPPAPQQRNVLHNQKLEWLNGKGQRFQPTCWFLSLVVFLLLV